MVHALHDIHRILKSHGTLIDLRPDASNSSVVLDLASVTLHVGEVDSSRTYDEKWAADKAMQHVVDDGLFILDHQTTFHIVDDLDTVDDLRAYRESFNRSVLADHVIERVAELILDEDDDYRIRVLCPMVIARYRKR